MVNTNKELNSFNSRLLVDELGRIIAGGFNDSMILALANISWAKANY